MSLMSLMSLDQTLMVSGSEYLWIIKHRRSLRLRIVLAGTGPPRQLEMDTLLDPS